MSFSKIILASSNQGKIKEFQQAFRLLSLSIITLSRYSQADIPETGLTFIENALIKARYASQLSGLPALADDSGLIVDALNGEPGLYSARYAGSNTTRDKNNAKLLANLAALNIPLEKRSARFYCALVFLKHYNDPLPIIAEGYWEGMILEKPQGTAGFGYEPLFYIPEYKCSAAEISLSEKLLISHRGKALHYLIKQLHNKFNKITVD